MMNPEQFVITGVGVATPATVLWQQLPQLLNVSCAEANPPDLEALIEETLGLKGLKYLDRCTRLTMLAGIYAAMSSGFVSNVSPVYQSIRDETGVVLGTTLGGLRSISSFDRTSISELSPLHVNPLDFPNTTINSPSSHLAIKLALKGPNLTISNGHTSGLDAMLIAKMLLESGMAQMVLAGGSEELSPEYIDGFASLMPEGKPTEGSAMLVLETAKTAAERDARPLAILKGGATGMYYDNSAGINKACEIMNEALQNAGVDPKSIDCVLTAHNASPCAVNTERAALDSILGPYQRYHTDRLGDSYSAGGALLAATATALILEGAKRALISAFGGSGQCTCIVLEAP